jgi:hypothetical protein
VDVEAVRVAVYRAFAETGRPPSHEALSRLLGLDEDEVRAALDVLAAARHVVLGDDGAIVMAHPFSAVPLGFAVMGARTLWWGGCAWDAFAVPHLVAAEPEVLVATRCPACATPHAWSVGRDGPPPGEQLAHFLVPVAHMWDDVVRTCSHQRLFCSRACIDRWLMASGRVEGYVMDVPTLWRLAAHWYDGRLERGYTRREPAAAAAFFRDVGLRGPFWGVD